MKNSIYPEYFTPKSVAERYFKGRPRYHPLIIEKIRNFLAFDDPPALSLDVGCGTGFSSVALRKISEKVIGCDISAEMLKFAESSSEVEFAVASGENLPFPSNKFDLLTVAQAIHWMKRKRFFSESSRVLKKGCLLVAYDNYFLAKITEDSEFSEWYRDTFMKQFPTPSRNQLPFATESEDPNALVLAYEERHENLISLTQQELVDYLITITNVISIVDKGEKSIEEVLDWMVAQTEKFFLNEQSRKFMFSAPIWYFKRYSDL